MVAEPTGACPVSGASVVRRLLVLLLLALVALTATSSLGVQRAYALESRPGAQEGQWDVLLDGVETERAARSLWGAAGACGKIARDTAGTVFAAGMAAKGAALSGAYAAGGVGAAAAAAAPTAVVAALGGGVAYLGCAGFVSTCAAQAYSDGAWAGMTVSPTASWCWTY